MSIERLICGNNEAIHSFLAATDLREVGPGVLDFPLLTVRHDEFLTPSRPERLTHDESHDPVH
jgi:hypothetical protein